MQLGVHVGTGWGVDRLFNQISPPKEENDENHEFTQPSNYTEDYLNSIGVLPNN